MGIAPARRVALQALLSITESKQDLPSALGTGRSQLEDDRDRSLVTEVVTGTLRWLRSLDYQLEIQAERTIGQMDPVVRDILRLSLYQMLHLQRIPTSAIVNDAVQLTKLWRKQSAAGFVNAVLRSIARGRANLAWPDADDPLAYVSITLSHPSWLAARWIKRLGPDRAAAWARFNNRVAPLTLKVNRLKATPREVAAKLRAIGVSTEPCHFAPDGLIVSRGNPMGSELFADGLFFVQDETSQLVTAYAGAKPGEVVLDACAAPGGKTVGMAATMENRGLLIAADVRPRRLRLLKRTIAKSGADIVTIVRSDLLQPAPFQAVFDRVLIDAPCSGLGTIRRDPDIRWRRTESELATHATRQQRMLVNIAHVVKPGGVIVYSTCSTEPEENEQVVDRFLAERPGFRLVQPAREHLLASSSLGDVLDERGCLRTLPDAHGLEGFFAATLRREEEAH